eukprot:SAG31_NODE_41896_length_274_cov_0.582857_1_plen_48_part_01
MAAHESARQSAHRERGLHAQLPLPPEDNRERKESHGIGIKCAKIDTCE